MSLITPELKKKFDEIVTHYPDDQKQAVRDRDFNRMIELGGNIYFVSKVGATDGLTYVQIVSSMTENDAETHNQMMIDGGRSPDGNRYTHEWEGR